VHRCNTVIGEKVHYTCASYRSSTEVLEYRCSTGYRNSGIVEQGYRIITGV
jgi:uncharacterized protein with HEPN domain